MFSKLVSVPSGAMIPDRDIDKSPILQCINLGVFHAFLELFERDITDYDMADAALLFQLIERLHGLCNRHF